MGFGDLFKRAFQAILDEYGGFAALFALMLVYLQVSRDRLWQARLDDKDREITRVAEERNKLQAFILKERITSRGGNDRA